MQVVFILLRLVHIVAGAFWVGGALLLALIILPSVRRAGPEGGRALRTMGQAQISQAMSTASLLTVLAGLLLYAWALGNGLGWLTSARGLGFTAGAVVGLAAFLLGILSTGPTARRLGAMAAQIEAAGGPPNQEQAAALGRLQAKLARSSSWGTILATVSLIFMAIARYL